MKSIGEIMKELGFDPKGSPNVQKALIKHMINQINANPSKLPEKSATEAAISSSQEPVQLSFDFGDSKKVS